MFEKSIPIDEYPLIDNTPEVPVEEEETRQGRTIVLIACVGQKQGRPMPAQDLYTSAWFRKAAAYARRQADAWYILSAKHGLVLPENVIEPYDMTLNTMKPASRRTWALQALLRLYDKLKPGDRVIILAGKHYREFLVPSLEKWGCQVEIPLEGLRIGEQLSWFNKN